MSNELSAFRGDTYSINVNVTNQAGTPVNIAGYTLFLTIKRKVTDSDSDALVQKTVTSHVSDSGGQSLFTLTPSDTEDLAGQYFYDIQWKKPDNSIKTIVKGLIRFETDVTLRIS